jgi:AraC family ethanolamine operon transcriptional activator
LRYLAFTDFEAYIVAIRDADLRMMLPRMRQPRWEISALPVGGIHIQHGREGGGNLTEGAGRDGASVLFLPAAGVHRANGSPLDDRSVLVIEPRSEFSIAVQEPHTWYSVSVPRDTVRFEQSDDEARTSSGSRVLAPGADSVARIRTLLSRVIEAARVEPEVLTAPAAVARIKAELLAACRPVVGSAPVRIAAVGRPVIPREHIIRSAITLIEQSPDFTLGIDDMAEAADVSIRTLRNAFLEYFGVPPVRYLATRRLHEARRALRAADSEATTVTAVATRFGFWQFGRFAADYRRLFGEYPSETLKPVRRPHRRPNANTLLG